MYRFLRRAAAAINGSRSAATPPRAAPSIYQSNDVSRVTGITRTSAPPRAASSIDVARIAGLTGPTSPPLAASSSHVALFAGRTRAAASSSDAALFAGFTRAAVSSSDAALFAGLTRSAASFRAPAGLLTSAPARFGVPSGTLTRGTAPTAIRGMHFLPVRPIDPHVLIALQRLDSGEFQRHKDIGDAIEQLRVKLTEDDSEILLFLTEQIVHVGTVSWRVCTTVITVAVGAGFGVLQLAKGGWEEQFHESACSLITTRLTHIKAELEDYMVKSITHRRNVAAANAFLENEETKERTLKIEQREAVLAAKEADILAREAILAEKEALPVKVVSSWGWLSWR